MMSSDDGYGEEVSGNSQRVDSPSSPSPPEQHVGQLLQNILHSLYRLEHRMGSVEENQKQLMKNNEMLLKTLNIADSASNGRVDNSRVVSDCLADPPHIVPEQCYTGTCIQTARSSHGNEIHQFDGHTSLSSIRDDSGFQDEEISHSTSHSSLTIPEAVISNMTATKLSNTEANHPGYHGEHEPVNDRKVKRQQPRQQEDEDALIKSIEAQIIPDTMTEFNKPKLLDASQPSEVTTECDTITRCDTLPCVLQQAAVCAAQDRDLSDTHQTSQTPVYEHSAGCLPSNSPTRTEVVEEVIVPCHLQPLGLGRITQGETWQSEHVEVTGSFTLGGVSEREVAGSVDEVTLRTIGMSEVERLLDEDTEDELDGREGDMILSVNQQHSPNQCDQEAEALLKGHLLELAELDPDHVRHIFTQPYLKPYLRTMSDLLHQILRHKQQNLHQALWKVIAGIAPSVFYKAFGYNPDRQERDFIISEFSSQLKETIKNMKSSQADKIGDRSIQLDTDYIQLRVFGGKRHKARATIPANMRNTSSDDSDSDSDSDSDTDVVDGKLAAVAEILEEEEAEWELPYVHQQREAAGGGQEDIPVLAVLEEGGGLQVGRMVLIKGRPGVGKTTTCQWLYRQWALGRFATRFSMFFIIHIRHLIHVKDQEMSLCGLLSNYCLAVKRAGGLPAYMKPWMEFNEEHILLAIDGIDEMPDFADCLKSPCEVTSVHQHARPLHLIANILKRSLLPSATVILLSRGFTDLKEIPFDRMMEIKGLSQDGVLQFVYNFAPEHRVEDIQNILWRNPLLMSVCTITVYCLLICSALADDITLPGLDLKTYTRIYSFIIMHYLQRSDRLDGVRDADCVGLRYSSLLTTLASLAQTGFNQRPVKMIFTGFDLEAAEVNLQEVVRTGLMAVDSDVPCDASSPDERVTTASYLHLSVQEYLASTMVTQLSPEDLQKYISTELQRGQFEMALLFCYGQVFDRDSQNVKQVHHAFDKKKKKPALGFKSTWKPNEEVLIDIYESILESADESDVYVKMAVLAHESQSPLVAGMCADHVMDKSSSMEFSDSLMTVVDMMSVMFVVNHSRNLKHLRIQRCGMDAACVRLMEDFLVTTNTLKTLSLPENEIGNEGAEQLCQILKRNKTLKHLCLSYTHVGDPGLEAIASFIEVNDSLQSLELAGNNFSNKGLAALANAIRKKTSFKTLNICNNPFLTDGCRQYLRLLQNHPPKGFCLRMDSQTKHDSGPDSGYESINHFDDMFLLGQYS